MAASFSNIVLTLLAHPDDAEILCGGTLIRLRALGWEVHVVTLTAGDCGTVSLSAAEISVVRRGEATRAAGMIGAQYHCLEEMDGFVVYDKGTLRKTIDLFRRVAPSLVITHAAKDYMMDHEQTHLLARAASFVFGAPNVSELPLLAGSGVPYLYYCDPIEGIDPLGNKVSPTTFVDVTDVMKTKAAMLGCHASQREWLAAHHGMDEYIDAMKRHGRQRGRQMGVEYAEGFVQHRGHAYPADDLLGKLLARES